MNELLTKSIGYMIAQAIKILMSGPAKTKEQPITKKEQEVIDALQKIINLLPKEVKLTNCRVLSVYLPQHLKANILGFAHPSRYHRTIDENKVMEIVACRSQTLISLDPIIWPLKEIFRKSGGKYYCLPVTDFEAPTPD